MINENNLKINTILNGGSEIDVSKISIDNFDVSKNNLYLFKNPDFEFTLDQKNLNSEYWKTIPEDSKETKFAKLNVLRQILLKLNLLN